ncbi:BAG family molecular chaperone regulator 5, mitochondrial-like [Argentina anserina]|uniref:BAG family molecular chaperone regulator 5, mitochondrial-like n=1 Tax=Argentina anserina TaxID=57926 RepID=UPI00217622F8|nr:BAG family molecular chaperone regulator 5, mitochondrial-like [Potentilla anserina]
MASVFHNLCHDKVPISHYHSQSKREIPMQHSYYCFPNINVPIQPAKIETIPVQSALKIEKVFRGFLVRKSVSKIAGIKREVDEISKLVSKEMADFLRIDAKERLKVVETLMSLLLKLDAVKGVDSGVRDLRRAVIKKTIALQDRMEAYAASHQPPLTERKPCCSSCESNKKNSEEILQKMVDENQRLVGIVMELVHRNEKQTQLLGSLSKRVEMLEETLINERVGRKRARRSQECREEFF